MIGEVATQFNLSGYLGHEVQLRPRRDTAELWELALQNAASGSESVRSTSSFLDFVRLVNSSLLRYEHISRLVDVGQRIVDGQLKRVMILMPPQYFKTEIFGRLLPAYFLQQQRRHRVAIISYGADLAWSTSEEARDYYQQAGGTLRIDTTAKRRWRTQEMGQLWAAGVGGAMLGFGFELGIVDDPTDPEKAHSPKFQRRFTEWWPSKFLSRQGPGAAIVLVQQRLGIDDPVDWLFRREVGEDTDAAPEHWHVVACDEIKSDERLGRWDGPRGLPPTCTIEPDERPVGQVLAPSYRDRIEVLRLHNTSSAYVVAAQRQQRPARPTGDFWHREWFVHIYDQLPADAYNGGKDWDTAYTENESNSASAYVESYRGLGKEDEFPIYIQDLDWDWLEFPELVYWMGGPRPLSYVNGRQQIIGPHYVEAKATGKSAVQTLRKQGVPAKEVVVPGGADKFARSNAVQPVVSAGRVWVRRQVFRKLLEAERMGLLRVTAETLLAGGPDLDLNDAFTQALHRHVGTKRRMRVYSPAGPAKPTVVEQPARVISANRASIFRMRRS